MTYRCLGNGNYELTLKVYRDCQGGGAGFDGTNNGRISIYQGDSQVEFDRITMSAASITDIDADIGNPCLIVPPNVCVEQGVYTLTLGNQGIFLPQSNESYYIVYQRCCRNNSITNMLNPESTGATFFVEVTPEAQALCNNTPTFDDFPPIVICVNEPLQFDHSATDIDGDLLVYELCSPLKGGGVDGWMNNLPANGFTGTNPNPDKYPPYENINFIAPTYSTLNPLGGSSPLTIDAATGMLTGVPETEGQFVVGICVKEYRNGVLLSTIQRDFQFNVSFCEPTVVAEIINPDATSGDTMFIFNDCDGTFDYSFSAETSQFIDEYLWEFDLGGLNPLNFNQNSINITFPDYGNYIGTLYLNPGTDCSDTAFVEVNIFEPPFAMFTFDYDTCVAGPVNFEDFSTTESDSIQTWQWNFGDGQTSTEQNPIHNYTSPGTYNVTLQVTDANDCTNQISQSVTWLPVPPLIVIDPSAERGCAPLEVFFDNLSTPIDATYDIVWEFGDGGIDSSISPLYSYQEPGTYTVHVGITSPIGCYTERTFTNLIEVDSFPKAQFTFGPDRITNFKPEVSFFDASLRAEKWVWDFNNEGTSFLQNPTFTFQDTGLQVVELVAISKNGCTDTIQRVVDVIPEVRYFLPNAFTPNDDTKNDVFEAVGFYRGMKDYHFTIWNRHGELVFETRNPNEGWNGRRFNGGGLMPAGVYVVLVNFIGPRGKPYEIQGYATLIK